MALEVCECSQDDSHQMKLEDALWEWACWHWGLPFAGDLAAVWVESFLLVLAGRCADEAPSKEELRGKTGWMRTSEPILMELYICYWLTTVITSPSCSQLILVTDLTRHCNVAAILCTRLLKLLIPSAGLELWWAEAVPFSTLPTPAPGTPTLKDSDPLQRWAQKNALENKISMSSFDVRQSGLRLT